MDGLQYYVRIKRDGVLSYFPFGDEPMPPVRELFIMGYLCPPHGPYYMDFPTVHTNHRFLCVSQLGRTVPTYKEFPDYHFEAITFHHFLDFSNTAFEFMKLHHFTGCQPLLSELEAAAWNPNYRGFIPFRNPYPLGYQGVYGTRLQVKKLLADGVHPTSDNRDGTLMLNE